MAGKPIIIDDNHNNSDLAARSDHTSPQMTVNDLGLEGENTDGDADDVTYMGEGVIDSDPVDATTPQGDRRSAIATSASFSPELPESDCAAI